MSPEKLFCRIYYTHMHVEVIWSKSKCHEYICHCACGNLARKTVLLNNILHQGVSGARPPCGADCTRIASITHYTLMYYTLYPHPHVWAYAHASALALLHSVRHIHRISYPHVSAYDIIPSSTTHYTLIYHTLHPHLSHPPYHWFVPACPHVVHLLYSMYHTHVPYGFMHASHTCSIWLHACITPMFDMASWHVAYGFMLAYSYVAYHIYCMQKWSNMEYVCDTYFILHICITYILHITPYCILLHIACITCAILMVACITCMFHITSYYFILHTNIYTYTW